MNSAKPTHRKNLKLLLLLLFVAAAVASWWFDLNQLFSFERLKSSQAHLQNLYLENPSQMAGIFLLVYITSAALSLPGAAILTLAAGAIFGLQWGVVLVSFASTIGATLAFLSSRFLFREFVQSKFRDKISQIDAGVSKEGAFYLFTLRLVPVFPFFLVNLVMGLTSLRTSIYFLVSQVGMFPGTVVYVNAGTQLAKLEGPQGLLNPALIFSFALLGFLPLFSKKAIAFFRSRKYLRRFKKPKGFDYNLIVIGGGSAGLVSAYIAAAVKSKVAIIEKEKMGGDCLNTGCVPSKALIRSAKVSNYIRRATEFGLEETAAKVNFPKVMERVRNVIQDIAPHDSTERYTSLGVECFSGEAFIVSPYEVKLNGKILTAKSIIVATGAGPLIPKIPGLDLIKPLTSDTVWNLTTQPKDMVVLGGGPIGCELAQAFARLGTKVTLVERSDRLLSREDDDVSKSVAESFEKDGVRVLTSHHALRIEKTEGGARLVCSQSIAGGTRETAIPFDQILLALGRKPRVTGFGLEELGVEISPSGTVAANEYLQTTNYPNIYVCGDVAGPYQFTHVAAHQAWFASVNALFSPFKTFKVDYRVIPWCTFTDPEVARVGLSETEAQQKGISVEVTKYGIDDLDRAIADGDAHGFVKVLTPPGSDRILGVTAVGAHAGEIIGEYVTAMKYGLGLNKILGTIHIYPTFSEANKYAAGVWKRQNAPQRVLKALGHFHSWRRG